MLIYTPGRPCCLHLTLSRAHPRDLRYTDMARICCLVLCAAAALQAGAASLSYGPSTFAPTGAFPTQWYNSYYNDPTATTAQPQPVISDPVLVSTHISHFSREVNSP